jgi:hypothetical protein
LATADVDEWAGKGKLKDFKTQLNKFKVKQDKDAEQSAPREEESE